MIGDPQRDPRLRVVAAASASLGHLKVSPVEGVFSTLSRENFDVIVVDAAAVDQLECFVSALREKQANSQIVVISGMPTWKEARAAFRAGAKDYIGKSMDGNVMMLSLERALECNHMAKCTARGT